MINKNLMLVAMLSMGTALTTLGKVKPALASLTPPTTYNYSYTWNATDTEQYLNVNGVDSIPLYTRTADGVYYNYTNTTNIIDGLNVTMTFNRSNTTWQASGIYYKPDENKIGSNNTVGSLSKFYFKFDNQTNKNYILYLDFSSTTGDVNVFVNHEYNDIEYDIYGITTLFNASSFSVWFIPAFTKVEFTQNLSSNLRYFDAWYLQDLGVSQAWQAGYDADTQGILTDYLGTDAQQIGWVLLGIAAILFVFKGGK
jgi:hypothetical protein